MNLTGRFIRPVFFGHSENRKQIKNTEKNMDKRLKFLLHSSFLSLFIFTLLNQSLLASNAGNETKTIESIVATFHRALAVGDKESALTLLTKDVMVLENGHIETANEYLSYHLDADLEFSSKVSSQRKIIKSTVEGKTGWVISASIEKGEYHGKQIDSTGAELMILEKWDGKWKIKVIHWSSRKN